MALVRVLYSCHTCGLEKVPCDVLERDEDEVVTAWVDQKLVPTIHRDHQARTPGCPAEKISEVAIPVTGAKRVGEVPRS